MKKINYTNFTSDYKLCKKADSPSDYSYWIIAFILLNIFPNDSLIVSIIINLGLISSLVYFVLAYIIKRHNSYNNLRNIVLDYIVLKDRGVCVFIDNFGYFQNEHTLTNMLLYEKYINEKNDIIILVKGAGMDIKLRLQVCDDSLKLVEVTSSDVLTASVSGNALLVGNEASDKK